MSRPILSVVTETFYIIQLCTFQDAQSVCYPVQLVTRTRSYVIQLRVKEDGMVQELSQLHKSRC